MIILGAGMSGCLAGIINPQATIFEAQDTPPINHNAVLRFRDDSVSKITGIPFKEVTVRKAIFSRGKFAEPNISVCNAYSRKVTGKIQDRSIWHTETVKRFVAPPDFQKQLFDLVSDRVILDSKVTDLNEVGISNSDDSIISTLPMTVMCKLIGLNPPEPLMHKGIHVITAELPVCDVYQTVYFPDYDDPLYRATVTGNKLILEFTAEIPMTLIESYMMQMAELFESSYPENIAEQSKQQYGKIAPINDKARRCFLYNLTREYNIYSAGRFAIWKNVLMDDVLKDLHVIKEMQAKDGYEHHRRQ